jgi:hypothetical protein
MDSRKKIASVMAGINLALGIASMAGAASAAADGQSPESVAVDAIVKGSTLSPDDAKFLYESAKTFLCP